VVFVCFEGQVERVLSDPFSLLAFQVLQGQELFKVLEIFLGKLITQLLAHQLSVSEELLSFLLDDLLVKF